MPTFLRNRNFLAACCLTLGLLVLCQCPPAVQDPAAQDNLTDDQRVARTACEQAKAAVRVRLPRPETAEFPECLLYPLQHETRDDVVTIEPDAGRHSFRVSGIVHSVEPEGWRRREWRAELRREGNAWEVDSISLK